MSPRLTGLVYSLAPFPRGHGVVQPAGVSCGGNSFLHGFAEYHLSLEGAAGG